MKKQTEDILDTLVEGELSTVFTNDSAYLSARDDLITVILYFILRKQQNKLMMEKSCSFHKSEKD